LDRNLRVFVGLLLVAAGCLLVLSCSDDETTTAPCTNCSYWDKVLGREGRYPSSCPTDPLLIAFSDTLDLSGGGGVGAMFYHIWVAKIADTTRYYQITSEASFDLKPAWSPDGTKIAFERGEAGAKDIWVVDVTDLEAPGEPVRFTDNTELEESNGNAAWVTVGGTEQWIAFTNSTNGGSDVDVVRMPYPGPGEPVWVTLDPSDFAASQNGVLGFIFRDLQAASNGSGLIAFSSPDRTPVGDIYVVARTEEESDTALVHAQVFINGKDSGELTPALFKYRPVQDSVLIEGQVQGYCSLAALDFRGMMPDTVNTTTLQFVHTHGTLAAASLPEGVHDVYIGTIEWSRVAISEEESVTVVDTLWVKRPQKTPSFDPAIEDPKYAYYTCVVADTVLIYAAGPYGPCSNIMSKEIFAGDTSYVILDCAGGAPLNGARHLAGSPGRLPVLGQTPEPYSLWVVDVDSEQLYLIAESETPISGPALSPDGRHVAYLRGDGAARQLVVSGDIQAFMAGTAPIRNTVIGLPGSAEDIECYRFPERVCWVYSGVARLVASLSICRGGTLPDDYEIWEADISDFVD
jgi:hypothetical protein